MIFTFWSGQTLVEVQIHLLVTKHDNVYIMYIIIINKAIFTTKYFFISCVNVEKQSLQNILFTIIL